MQNRELHRELQRIRGLVDRTRLATDSNLELQAHWGRYLCILVAGFLENAIGEIYSGFAHDVANAQAARFISSALSKVRNPKAQRFSEIANAFDSAWARELDSFMSDNGRKEAIDTIMANRHLIAHGKDTGITVARVVGNLNKCVEVIEFIENQCRK